MSHEISRRTALKSSGLTALSGMAVIASPLAAAQKESKEGQDQGDGQEYTPALGMGKGIEAQVVSADEVKASLTNDKLVATVRFGQDLDALTVQLGADSQPNSLTKVASFEVPVNPPPTADDESKKFLGFIAIVRGMVLKDKETRLVAMLDLGGSSHTLEFPYGEERSEDISERYFSFPASDVEVTTTEERVEVDGKLVDQTERTADYVKAPPHYTGVLTLSAQRRSGEGQGMITIQEMDIVLVEPKPPSSGGDNTAQPSSRRARGKAYRSR